MAKLNQKQKAQMLALRGEIDAALTEFSDLRSQGDVGASASLAEIAAYQGRWRDVVTSADIVFGSPGSVKTLNVYTDLVALVARAGTELGNWEEIRRQGKLALAQLTKKEQDIECRAAIQNLLKFASQRGEEPLYTPGTIEEQRRVEFEAAIEKMNKTKKKFKTPADRLDHLFGLANVYEYHPGAVLLYDQEKELPDIFDNVAFVASALARANRLEEAWAAIHAKLHHFWPVEESQVAPVVLLVDEGLRQVMTPSRCAIVLRTPRGPGVG